MEFPSSPVVGNIYNVGGINFLCTGERRFRPIPNIIQYQTVSAMKLSVIPAGHVAVCEKYYADGQYLPNLKYISRGAGWPVVADNYVHHNDSQGNFLELITDNQISITQAGARPTNPNNAPNINAALSTHKLVMGAVGDFTIQGLLLVPANTTFDGGSKDFKLVKGYHGDMLQLGKWSTLRNIRFEGNWFTYLGHGVIITEGENTSTVANQGHQLIESCNFMNMKAYPIAYTVANRGWMSKVLKCTFTNYDNFAAILWPDEPANGGNRTVKDCYSNGRLVNANGADNGLIINCVMGGVNENNQGVYFPPNTANRAKKIVIADNRFGIAGGSVDLRGADLIFTDNIIAGSVNLLDNTASDGCFNSYIHSKIMTGTLTDLSGAVNYLDGAAKSFTPTWTSTGTAPDFGNADVRCSYTRDGDLITATYFIVFGSTTTFGTGTWRFSLPVSRVTGITTDYVGAAQGRNALLSARTLAYSGLPNQLQLTTSAGNAVDATNPGAWASGDILMMTLQYRIF